MNKYQKALKTIKDVDVYTGCLSYPIYELYEAETQIIEKLVEEKIEQLSRMNKLIIDSQWECVASCGGFIGCWYHFGRCDVVKIYAHSDSEIWVLNESETEIAIPKDQFLLCFKPKGENE